MIRRLHELLPADVKITLLADRGFGDQKLFTYLGLLGWSYAIRFRQAIHLTVAERMMPASKWVPITGHAKMLRDVLITGKKTSIPAVVLKHQKGMKEAWCIATDRRFPCASCACIVHGCKPGLAAPRSAVSAPTSRRSAAV